MIKVCIVIVLLVLVVDRMVIQIFKIIIAKDQIYVTQEEDS